MAKIPYAISFLLILNASLVKSDPNKASEFLKGFIQGLQLNPIIESNCAAGLQSISEDSSIIIEDIKDLIENNTPGSFDKLASDLKDLFIKNENSLIDCNIAGLIEIYKTITGPNGYAYLAKNYFKHFVSIKMAVQLFNTCETDYSACGYYVGEIFRYVTGYSVQSSLKSSYFSFIGNDYGDLVEGFLEGLQDNSNVNSRCLAELRGFTDRTADIGKDLESIARGNFYCIQKLVKDLDSFNKNTPDFVTVCNLNDLIDRLYEITSGNGYSFLLKNYVMNKVQVMADLETMKKCDQDYLACGKALGDAFKLILGWKIK